MHRGVGQKIHQRLLQEHKVRANDGQLRGGFDRERVASHFLFGFGDGQIDDVLDLALIEEGLDVSVSSRVMSRAFPTTRFKRSEASWISPTNPVHGALMFLRSARSADCGLDGGKWRPNFVRHGIEQRLAKPLGFGEYLGLLRQRAQPLAMKGQSDLPGQRLKMFFLMNAKRYGGSGASDDAQDPVAAFERNGNRDGRWQVAGEFSSRLVALKRPLRGLLPFSPGSSVLAPWDRAGPTHQAARRDLRVEGPPHFLNHFLNDLVHRRRFSQFPRSGIKAVARPSR